MPSSGRVDERRRSSAAHVRAILDNTLDAVIALDGAGLVTFWNPRAEETFGIAREKAIGHSLAELILPERERGAFASFLARLAPGKGDANPRLEVEAQRAAGHVFLSSSPSPPSRTAAISASAPLPATSPSASRTTGSVRASWPTRRRARTQAETASRVRDEFLSMLSHELRTPLTAIVGWTYLLRGGRLDEATARRGLDAIERNAAAQAQVISDILDLSRMVGAKFRLNVRPFSSRPSPPPPSSR